MANDTLLTLLYSCLDKNLSQHLVTPGLWTVSPRLQPLGIATGSVMLLFFVIGLPSNIMIIVSITLQRLYQQPTHLLLLSLACADLLLSVLIVPIIGISGFAGGFILGSSDYTRCKVCQTGVSLIGLIIFSLHILALISIDRFVFVKYPLRYNKLITQKAVLIAIVIVCTVSIVLALLPLFGVGDIHFDHATFSCSPRFDYMTGVTKNIHYVVLVVVEALIPLTVLLVTNVWVLCIAQRHIREIYRTKKSIKDVAQKEVYYQTIKSRLNQLKARQQLRLLRMFGVLLISHMVVWIPLIIRTIEAVSLDSDNFSPWSNFIVITSVISHPILHPLIEACFLPEIRKQFSVLCLKHCKNKPSPNTCQQLLRCYQRSIVTTNNKY